MSLMNDALRKKKRETAGNPSDAGLPDPRTRRPPTIRRSVVVSAALVLLGSVLLGGLYWMHSMSGGSLAVNPSLAATTRPPMPAHSAQPPGTGSSAARDTNPASSPAQRPDPINRFGQSSAEAPLASATATSDHPRKPDGSLSAVAEARGEPAASVKAPPMPTTPAPTESPRPGYSAYEPGPDPSIRRHRSAPAAEPGDRPADRPSLPVTSPSPTPDSGLKAADIPDDTDLFFQKALACHRNGRLSEAIRLYGQVIRRAPDHAQATLNLAAVYIETGRFNQARPLLNRLEAMTPRPAGVLLNQAITAIGSDTPQTAMDYLDRAEALGDASPWEIRFHRAVALSRMHRLSEARAVYHAMAIERPDDSRVRFNLAVTCDTLGLYRDALTHYEVLLKAPAPLPGIDAQALSGRTATIRRYLNSTRSLASGQ